MLSNIIRYMLEIINFAGRVMVWLFGAVCESIMFVALFVCGALGFGVFILFMLFMLAACVVAILL